MIHLSCASAAVLYLSLTVGMIFVLWFSYHFQRKRRTIFSHREELYVCEYCHCLYLEDPAKPNTQCPECKSYNKGNHYK